MKPGFIRFVVNIIFQTSERPMLAWIGNLSLHKPATVLLM